MNKDLEIRMTAMRIARNLVKNEMRRLDYKIDSFAAKDITKAAKKLITEHPQIMEEAKRQVSQLPHRKATR